MSIQLTLASRYLLGRKLRTVLTTLAIVFGVVVIFGMNTLLPAFVSAFHASSRAAAGKVDATFTLKTGDSFDESLAQTVAGVDGVETVSAWLSRPANLPPDYFDGDPAQPDAVSTLSLVGLEVERATAMHAYVPKSGRFLEAGDTTAAVITESLAEAIGLGVGDALTLPTPRGEVALTVVGLLGPRVMPGNEEVLVTLAQAQTMLAMPGRINIVEANYDSVEAARREAIESNLLATLGPTYQIGSLASNSELLTNLRIAQSIFSVLGSLALLMGGFIIFNTFRTLVAERRRDIGMLRAVGASRGTIVGVILSEGLVQGVLGTAFGLALGYLLGLVMVSLMRPMLHEFMNIRLGAPVATPGLLVVTIVIGVGVTLLAGLLPALSASRVTPLDALRPPVGAVSLRRMAGLGFWTGVVLIGLALAALFSRQLGLVGLGGVLFVLGLMLCAPALVNPIANLFGLLLAAIFARGGTAQLAQGNLARQPTRAAITASTTLLGMAILVMAATMIGSIYLGFGRVMRKSLGSDYVLLPTSLAVWGTNVGAGPALERDLSAVDGVAVVSAVRYAPTLLGEQPAAILGIDPATYPQVSGLTFSSGDETTAYAALDQGRSVIANPVLASTKGLKVGETIDLLTPTGPQPYRLVAIAGDYLNSKIPTAYISHANIEADFGRNEAILYQANLAPGADPQAVEAGLRASLKAYPQFRLIVGEEFIAENLRIFNAAFSGMVALLLFLSVPSLIAMVNTLAIGVIERTREIGMLRAVGATRSQVRTVIVAEALILSALGTVFGVLSGLYLGYLSVQTMKFLGYPMEFVFPTQGLVLALAAGIVFGVLAAIVPVRQVSRLQIVQALRYE